MSNINGFLRPVIYLETGVRSRVIIFAVWFFSTAISLQGAVHQKRRKWLLTEVKKKQQLKTSNITAFLYSIGITSCLIYKV